MDNSIKLRFIAFAAAALMAVTGLWAQNGTISPYSRFGVGLLSEQSNAEQRGMGGVGYAMRNGRTINFMNPASYAAIDTLTFLFDMAFDTKSLSTTEGSDKGKNFTGGLDYVTLEVPVTRYGGACLGLIPYSQTGYNFGDEIVNGHNSHEGTGAINELFLGLSARPFKNFSLGANLSYMFGTLNNNTYIYTEAGNTSLFQRTFEVRDFNVRAGIQYQLQLNRDNQIGIGVVYSPKMNFRGHTYGSKYDLDSDSKVDTIGYTKLNGAYQRAETWGAGISWEYKKRYYVEADFTYQPWKNAKFSTIPGFDSEADGTGFDNRWRAALGVSITPNQRGPWLSRVAYRFGGYYGNDYVRVAGNSIREYGATIGLGLPAPSAKTVVNLAFEYRHRQATPNPLVKENYFLVTVGVTVNELWFWRNKIR